MRRRKKTWILTLITCILCLLTFSACKDCTGGLTPDSSEPVDLSGIPARIEAEQSVTIKEYNTYLLNYAVYDAYGNALQEEATISSADETIVKVDGKSLIAYAIGETQVTLTVKEISATCQVKVTENESIPKLVIEQESVESFVGGELPVSAYILYDGRKITDASYTYQISDPTIASVSESGSVTGVKEGETLLTVTGTWRGKTFLETIAVKIKELLSLSWADGGDVELYTSDIQGGKTSTSVQAKVFRNGTAVALTEENLTYFQCNAQGEEVVDGETILLSQTGEIKALGRGTVYVSYTYLQDGESFVAKPIRILAQIPVIETGLVHVEDLQATDVLDYHSILPKLGLNAEDVKEISLHNGDEEIFLQLTDAGAKGVDYKDKTLIVYNNDGYAHKISLELYTLVISNVQEFSLMSEYLEANKYNVGTEETPYYESDGYFIMDTNVDFNGGSFVQKFIPQLNADKTNGFVGIFDGKGYAVENLTMGYTKYTNSAGKETWTMGFVGSLGVGGTFQNVNVKNYKSGSSSLSISVVGTVLNGTVKNVSVSVNDSYVRNTGVLAQSIQAGALVQNVVVTLKGITWSGSEVALLAHDTHRNARLRNVYVIDLDGSVTDFESTWAKKSYYGNTFNYAIQDGENGNTCAFFASKENFKNNQQTVITDSVAEQSQFVYDLSVFETELWDCSDIPFVRNQESVEDVGVDNVFKFEDLLN